jgi:Tfp pilus assembly protein PilW
MANTTRLRLSTSAQAFHRVGAGTDMAEHDVGTTDTAVSGLGGTTDFQIDSDDNTVYVDESAVFDATGTGVAIASSASISAFLHIKHTGFTSSAKTTATTQLLKVGIGDPDADGFSLSAGEAICLHGFGTGTSNISYWKLESASGDIYVEVLYF